MSEPSYRELYKASVEEARNRIVVEVQRQAIEHEKMIEAAHNRIANLSKENAELKLAVGALQEKVDKMANWLKERAEKEKKEKTSA